MSRVSRHLDKDIVVYQQLFGKDHDFNPWHCKDGKKLTEILFGPVRAPYIGEIWDMVNDLPYQRGCYRGSFRLKTHLDNKIPILQQLVQSGEK